MSQKHHKKIQELDSYILICFKPIISYLHHYYLHCEDTYISKKIKKWHNHIPHERIVIPIKITLIKLCQAILESGKDIPTDISEKIKMAEDSFDLYVLWKMISKEYKVG